VIHHVDGHSNIVQSLSLFVVKLVYIGFAGQPQLHIVIPDKHSRAFYADRKIF
jgi:hypothetical protein